VLEAPSLIEKKNRKACWPEALAELPQHVQKEREGHATLTEARAGSFTLATRGDAVITVTDSPAAGGKVAVAVEKLALLRATVLKEERMADSLVLATLRWAPEWVTGEHVVGGTDAVWFRLLKHRPPPVHTSPYKLPEPVRLGSTWAARTPCGSGSSSTRVCRACSRCL
jgi:hypothetical protein